MRVRLTPNCTSANEMGIPEYEQLPIVPGARGVVKSVEEDAIDVYVHIDGTKWPYWFYKADVIPDVADDDLDPLSPEE